MAQGLDGSSTARSVQKRHRTDIYLSRLEIYKRFISQLKAIFIDQTETIKRTRIIGCEREKNLLTLFYKAVSAKGFFMGAKFIFYFLPFCKPLQRTCIHMESFKTIPVVQYLENIGQAIEQSDWLISV